MFHWPVTFADRGQPVSYEELKVKMKALKHEIDRWKENWNDEWDSEACKPEVEVIISAERLEAYRPKVPISVVPSDSEYIS
ncbi:hypothetical protein NHQ30_000027 [Ciborinia camelliae]|nr:hypothetical protein NHQ30_000027 [Ciborinia camelliae]